MPLSVVVLLRRLQGRSSRSKVVLEDETTVDKLDRQEVAVVPISNEEEQAILGEGAECDADRRRPVGSEVALAEHDVAVAVEPIAGRDQRFKHSPGNSTTQVKLFPFKGTRAEPVPVCLCPLGEPVPCAFTGILIRKVNYLPSINSARYTQRIILLQTVKLGWAAAYCPLILHRVFPHIRRARVIRR